MGLMNLLHRIGLIADAKVNTAIDAAENPVEMTKEAIRNLRVKLNENQTQHAYIKAHVIELKSKAEKHSDDAKTWTDKANKLQDKLDAKELDEAKGNELILEALKEKEKNENESKKLTSDAINQESSEKKIADKIKELNNFIDETEEDLTSLEAREKTAKVSIEVNKELSDNTGVDTAKDLVERMKKKVEASEYLSTAYDEIDNVKTTKQEIDEVLKTSAHDDLLESFKNSRKK